MALDPTLPVLDPPTPLTPGHPTRWGRVLRWVAAAGYVTWFVHSYRVGGFPFDRERVLAWIAAGLLVTAIGHPARRYVLVLLDWFPFAVLLYFYDSSRGWADDFGRPVLVGALVRADRLLFFGQVPAAWLQPRLRTVGAGVGWWELGVSIVYASHFVLPFVLAGVLWWRSRRLWRQWVNRFLVLSFSAVLTYAAVPAAPPWYAAQVGLLPPIDRPVQQGWTRIGFYAAPAWFARGQDVANAFAALPSMHAGYSALVALYLFRLAGHGRWRWLLFAYPLAMAFTLVYAGEHYVVDILAGWLYVVVTVAVCDRMGRRWQARTRFRLGPTRSPVPAG